MLSNTHPIDPAFAELARPLARAAARGDVPIGTAYDEFRRRLAAATADDFTMSAPARDWFDSEVRRHLPVRRGVGQ